MQTLTGMDKVLIEDCYHLTTMEENVNWKKQHISCQIVL